MFYVGNYENSSNFQKTHVKGFQELISDVETRPEKLENNEFLFHQPMFSQESGYYSEPNYYPESNYPDLNFSQESNYCEELNYQSEGVFSGILNNVNNCGNEIVVSTFEAQTDDVINEMYVENGFLLIGQYVSCWEQDYQFDDIYNDLPISLFIDPVRRECSSVDIDGESMCFSLCEFIKMAYLEMEKDYMYLGNFLHVNYLLIKYISPVQSYFILYMYKDGSGLLTLHNGKDIDSAIIIKQTLVKEAYKYFEAQNSPLCIFEEEFEDRTVGDLCCQEYYCFVHIKVLEVTANGGYNEFLSYTVLLQPTNSVIVEIYKAHMAEKGGNEALNEVKQILFNNTNPYYVSTNSRSANQYRRVNYQYRGFDCPLVLQRKDQAPLIENSEEMEICDNEEHQLVSQQVSKHCGHVEKIHIGESESRMNVYLNRQIGKSVNIEENIYIKRRKVARVREKIRGSTKKMFFSLVNIKITPQPSNLKEKYFQPPIDDWEDTIELFSLQLDKRKRQLVFSTFEFYCEKDLRNEVYFSTWDHAELADFLKGDVKKRFHYF